MIGTIHERDLGLRIGVIVRRTREHQQQTQSSLAERAGVTQAEISLIETGQRTQLKTLDRVAQALDTRLSDMLRMAEDIGDVETVVREAREFVRETRKARKRSQTESQ